MRSSPYLALWKGIKGPPEARIPLFSGLLLPSRFPLLPLLLLLLLLLPLPLAPTHRCTRLTTSNSYPTPLDTMAQPASASQLPPGVTDPNYKPPPGRLGNLTVPQQHALSKLKKELEAEGHFIPERHDDALLLRSVAPPASSRVRYVLTITA